MAAVDAREPAGIQPVLDLADRQRAKIRRLAVEHLGVMRVGVDRDDRLDRQLTNETVALDPDMRRRPPRRACRRRPKAETPRSRRARLRTARPPAPALRLRSEARPSLGFPPAKAAAGTHRRPERRRWRRRPPTDPATAPGPEQSRRGDRATGPSSPCSACPRWRGPARPRTTEANARRRRRRATARTPRRR